MEGLVPSLADAGGWALFISLATLVVLGFVKGLIYPLATVRTLLAQGEKALESERELTASWKLAWEVSQKALDTQTAADREILIQSVALATKTIASFQEAASGGGELAQDGHS